MPQTLREARDDPARRRPFIHASAYAIPIGLPAFVVPGVLHPNLEESMVAASVAPPTPEQRKHSAYHFGAMSKILVKMLTCDMFEKSTFSAHPAYVRAKEEMINDRPTARSIGNQTVACVRVTPAASDRIPDYHVTDIDYDNAFRTLTYTLCRLRSESHEGPYHAEMFDKKPGCTIMAIDSVIMHMERARQIHVASGRGQNHVPFYDPSDPSAYDRTAAVLLAIAKRDTPKTVSQPSGGELLQVAAVRMVLDYGNHSFADFRNWTNGKRSPCCSFMTTAQDKKPLPNFPRRLGHVVPMKEFKRYAENGSVDHRINSFSCWAPFPPGAEGSARFYGVFIDWWVRNVANEPKAYELIPNTPKHRYVVLLGDGYAIAEERAPINYHVAGYFPIKDEIPFAYIRLAFMLDSVALIYNSPVKWVGGLRKCTGFRGRSRADQCHRPLPRNPCLYCGKGVVMGMHMCMECNRGIFYPTGVAVFRISQPMDPVCARVPDWLKEHLRKSPDEQLWAMVPDSEVAHLRNCSIARNVVEDHRKVAFFGGIVIKAIDCTRLTKSSRDSVPMCVDR